ncbi:MAG: glycosyltransferase family 1 protein [Chlamydiota bacterium]|nr:glycosyltransferase family 1 protein [Chlamydiota bacterium]
MSAAKRIGIDARWIFQEKTGIGEYTFCLLQAIAQIDQRNQYYIIFQSDQLRREIWEKLALNTKHNFHTVMVRCGVFSLLGQLLLPYRLKKMKLDVYHSTNFMIPFLYKPCSVITTFHDLIPFLFPEYAPKSKKSRFLIIYKWIVRRIIKKADYIIVDSTNSKKDMLKSFKISEDKIGIVLLGVSDKFMKQIPTCDLAQKFSIGTPYFLYVGRFDPYKNIMGLLRAFSRARNDFLKDHHLVIVGPHDPRYREVNDYITREGLVGVVHTTGYVDDDALVEIYRCAQALILPSFYEGFGLPILEAFISRIPVIASNVASLPEVMGSAGIQVNPENQQELANAMVNIAQDEDLRQKLIKKGLERLEHFSWRKAAECTIKIYETL